MRRAVTIISFLLLCCDNVRKSEALSSSPSNSRRRRKRVVFTTHKVAPPLESLNEDETNNNFCQPLPITYTNDPETIGNWIHENIYSSPYSHVGFDVESVPKVPWIQSCNGWEGPATIQLSTPEEAIVVQLTHRQKCGTKFVMPSAVKQLLEDEEICKVGMGVDGDMMELYESCSTPSASKPLSPKCRCDLSDIYQTEKGGLKTFMKRILDLDLPKRKKVTISDWSRVPLKSIQLEYAARDAWAGAVLYTNDQNIKDLLLLDEFSIKELLLRKRQRKWARKQITLLRNQYHQYSIYYDKDQEALLNHTLEEGQALIQKEFHRLFQIIQDTAPPKRTIAQFSKTIEEIKQHHKP